MNSAEKDAARMRGIVCALTMMTGVLRAVTAVLGFVLRVLPGSSKKAP